MSIHKPRFSLVRTLSLLLLTFCSQTLAHHDFIIEDNFPMELESDSLDFPNITLELFNLEDIDQYHELFNLLEPFCTDGAIIQGNFGYGVCGKMLTGIAKLLPKIAINSYVEGVLANNISVFLLREEGSTLPCALLALSALPQEALPEDFISWFPNFNAINVGGLVLPNRRNHGFFQHWFEPVFNNLRHSINFAGDFKFLALTRQENGQANAALANTMEYGGVKYSDINRPLCFPKETNAAFHWYFFNDEE